MSTAPKQDINILSKTELNDSKFQDKLNDCNIQYSPVKIQQMSIDRSVDGPFITEANVDSNQNKKSSNVFANESLKSTSNSILNRKRRSRKSKNSQMELPLIEEIKEVKPVGSSMVSQPSMDIYDLSYRKIPPKLQVDSPGFRPTNANYIRFLMEMQKFIEKYGQNMPQSVGVISYAKPRKEEFSNTDDMVFIPRYLKVASHRNRADAFEIKKKILMSKYVHKEFDPGLESNFAKAYYEGVENASLLSEENITELIMRLGNYKGKIKPQISQIDIPNNLSSRSYRSRRSLLHNKSDNNLESKKEYQDFKAKLMEQLNMFPIKRNFRKSYDAMTKSLQKFDYTSKKFSIYSIQRYIESMIDKGYKIVPKIIENK